jgi:CheY-like chemotaxis protein/HPt (histidine-containing phosphotransfer) domain-containing protein
LIVDDNATNRFILEEMLAAWRMRPTAVPGGPEALEMLRRAAGEGEPFPLVLVDGHMPDMDGFSLTEQIRNDAQLRDVIVVMLTSGSQPGSAARRRELGLAASLTKPIKQVELMKTLSTVLGGKEQASEERIEPARAATHPLRILLAEDNPINQNLTLRLLGRQGHEVVVAGDGKEAVAALERRPFDLVLMDVQMPEMDGLEATRHVRANEAARGGFGPDGGRIPIVAMTAFAMTGDREKCLEAGMDGYVTKPVRAQELFETIERVAGMPPTEDASTATAAGDDVDWPAALDYVGGDARMLRDLIEIFLAECPRWLEELRRAIAGRVVGDVKRLAHNLKGSVRLFGAKNAFDPAFLLEQMGRNGNLSGAPEALAKLEESVARLAPTLRRFAEARE